MENRDGLRRRYPDQLGNATLAATLGDYATAVALTPSTGGSTIDADGNLCFSDTSLLAIWRVLAHGVAVIIVPDLALIWTDPMWVTSDNLLWLRTSQMRPGSGGLMADGPTASSHSPSPLVCLPSTTPKREF